MYFHLIPQNKSPNPTSSSSGSGSGYFFFGSSFFGASVLA
jgi:hypothetical protein